MSPYKDPDAARDYQKNYQRKRRASSKVGLTKKLELKGVPINTSQDLQNIISAALHEVVETPMEAAQRSRCIAQLCTVAIRLQEVGDLEQRMLEVEKHLGIMATAWR